MAYQHFFGSLLSNHTADISKIGCTHLADRMEEIKTKTTDFNTAKSKGKKKKPNQLLKSEKCVLVLLSHSVNFHGF